MSSKEKNKGSSVLQQWRQRKNKTGATTSIGKRPADQPAVASSGQQRLWLLQQLYPQNPFYQYGHLYKITGKFNLEALQQSFQQLIGRHEILRSNFVEEQGQLMLKTQSTSSFAIQTINLEEHPHNDQEAKANTIAFDLATRLYDLSNDLLLRVAVIRFSKKKHWVVLGMHHIIGDRESLQVLNKEVFSHYQAVVSEQSLPIEALNIQYSDYAHWQKKRTTKSKDLDYWLKQLSGDLPVLSLPHDHKRPLRASFEGKSISKKLSPELSDKLRQLAKSNNTTLYVLLLAAFKTLLYRHAQQRDLLIGSPFSSRDKLALEKLIGFFNETLVLRSAVNPDLSFMDWVEQVKATILKALEHKNVPFDEVVSALQPERHGSANPVFQVMYLYNRVAKDTLPTIDLEIEEAIIDLKVSKFDLTLFVNDDGERLETVFEFTSDLFETATIERMQNQLEVLLQSVAATPLQKLSDIPLLDTAEKNKITKEWNDTDWEMPAYTAIHQLIEEMAEQHPDRIAVVYKDESLTYRELNLQATAIAHTLINAGVSPTTFVGLYAHRSVAMMAGILGILKAGAAYLPLDPAYPDDRIQHMLSDSGAGFVLTQGAIKKQLEFSSAQLVSIESAVQNTDAGTAAFPEVDKEHPAYLIYTSGSTGLPKGVPIPHKNVLHSTLSRYRFYPCNPDSFLLLSSFSFDSSVVGIFWTLCSGGKLVLPPSRIEQDVRQLSDLIYEHQVTHTLMLPSLYSAILNLVEVERLSSLKNVMVAGEACPFSLIDSHYQLLPQTELYNEYGPTEASVWCIAHKIRPDEKSFVPIGRPIPNTAAYILDQTRMVLPIGVPGELYIGGKGISEGYLNNPELTKEKFIPHPFDKGKTIYKTGDLARFHENGLIEFLGRIDHQVKIRGFRVEPGEIQKVILQNELVSEAIVIVHTNDTQKQLIAYTSPLDEVEINELRSFCNSKLPHYMVPTVFVPLDSFPRLPNGKINRKALPLPDLTHQTVNENFTEANTALEKLLTDIWQTVLKVESIGIHDNFFSIGGDSILSIQVVSKARDKDIQLAPNQLFEYQTIYQLAKSIEEGQTKEVKHSKEIYAEETLCKKLDQYPLSHLQKAFLFNSKSSEHDQGVLSLEFLLEGDIDPNVFQQAWHRAAERHDAMRSYISTDETAGPIQKIAEKIALKWQTEDWSIRSESEQKDALKLLRSKKENVNLDLYNAPVSLFHLIKLSETKHLLFWNCHHIFLDGWSCGIILKDALVYYDAISNDRALQLPKISNYPAYLHWEGQQDGTAAKQFWSTQLDGFTKALSFSANSSGQSAFKDSILQIDAPQTKRLKEYCQQNQITLSTLFQGIWAMLLGRLFNTNDVLYGLTVSGRFARFQEIAATSGLFMNVIPNRFILQKESTVGDWLRSIQKEQGLKNAFENSSLHEIQSLIDWPVHRPLFDSLFVFGNFLKDGMQEGQLSVQDFKGGFSSAYPLTIRINPLEAIEVNYRYDAVRVSSEQFDWINATLQKLVQGFTQTSLNENLGTLLSKLAEAPRFDQSDKTTKHSAHNIAPRTIMEAKLHEIWQSLFEGIPIGINSNFFELGGNSLMALQLFSRIEEEMGRVLPPATLFSHPSIEALANTIESEAAPFATASCLVPLREVGDKPPLFCLHGGGAHVFFYKAFCEHLPIDQPVYSLQPPGLDGKSALHKSITEMAAHYLTAIRSVQANGPYYILGTCFSNAVALEMANQLNVVGEQIAGLFIIDSGPVHLFGDSGQGESKTFARFFDMLKRGDFERIKRKLKNRLGFSKTVVSKQEEPTSAAHKNLQRTVESLNQLYAGYNWKPYPGTIQFIRSSEFNQRADKKYHLTQWNKLAKGGLQIHVVEGHHKTLFEEPEVQALSKKVNQCIVNSLI